MLKSEKNNNIIRCLKKVVSFGLVGCLTFNLVTSPDVSVVQSRTIDVDSVIQNAPDQGKAFHNGKITYNKEQGIVKFNASNPYSKDQGYLFDKVSLVNDADNDIITIDKEMIENQFNEEELIDIEKAEELLEDEKNEDVVSNDERDCNDSYLYDEDLFEDAEVEYECSFDMKELEFEFDAELVSEDGTVLDSEHICTPAIITETGGLDALIYIDGEQYRMSDYANNSAVDDCSIETKIAIIESYLATARVAQLVKSKSNYKYNKQLEKDKKGVSKGNYVYSQSCTTIKGYKAGNYKFGFTTFGKVGCEVASAYNAAIALKESERLSQTIYFFELYNLQIASGWGI